MKKKLLLLGLILSSFLAEATHNRAGEITYEQINALTFRVTITTYTKTSSTAADRDSLQIFWGDGTDEYITRTALMPLANDIQLNQYVTDHTYPGRFTYFLSVTDPNRNGGILNVNFPQSDQIPFHLETKLVILNPQFQGPNSSPLLLQPPVDIGYVDQPFIHNPNAFDIEGDSLSYELAIPLQDINTPVSNYLLPTQIVPGINNQITLDETTGDFEWNSPKQAGEYNIAILINEFRNGVLISCIIRDMQITIKEGNNLPPEIESPEELCVVAGDTLSFDVIATDPDIPMQLVQLSALGGPLSIDFSPATFIAPSGFSNQDVVGKFQWITTCEHIQEQFYSVVFKARDFYELTSQGDTLGLSNLKTVRIKVVGPSPEGLTAEAGSGFINIAWDSPYFCENAADEYFKGFSVWRKEGSNPFELDSCRPGLEGRGYTQIANFDETYPLVNNQYTYEDEGLERGKFYCYRILAHFALNSPGGFPYNFIESLPSQEVCVQLNRDIPIITKADVLNTDVANGNVQVEWSKPNLEDLDTLQNPGPYQYKLYHSEGFTKNNPQLIYTSPFYNFIGSVHDTFFLSTGLNTDENPNNYHLDFIVNGGISLGETPEASSVYLDIISTDELNILSWEANTSWQNYQTIIYRQDQGTTTFDSIGITNVSTYNDEGLINGVEYCYYVKTIGSFSVPELPSFIENRSQEICGIPLDTIPPCSPRETGFSVESGCETATDGTPSETIFNTLFWSNPEIDCDETDDVASYNIFYAPSEGEPFTLIETIEGANNTSYIHQLGFTAAGCYAITAIDSVGNESDLSNIICVDNCPIYTLPNVFTPNGDGSNEIFHPFPYRYVDRINIKIFNRWGQMVFQSEDPDINWNGKNLQGVDLSEGVYFYICEVYESRIEGIVPHPEVLKGNIHIYRNGQ